MTTPALTAATGSAGLAGASAGPTAPEGVFAGLLADAAPADAASTGSPDGAGLLGLLELPVEDAQELVLPDGTLLGAAALGLVPAPLLLDAPPVGDGDLPAPTAALSLAAAPGAAPLAAAGEPVAEGAVAPPLDLQAVPAPRSGDTAVQTDVPLDVPAPAVPTATTTTGAPAAGPTADEQPASAVAPTVTAAPPAALPVDGVTGTDQDLPVDTAPAPPVGSAPVDRAPVEQAPVEQASVEQAPVEQAPVQAVPVQPATTAPGTAAPAAPAPLERLAAETGPEQVRPAVAELARGLRDAGGGRASLVVRLDPPELGPVLVRLTVQDGRVDVQLRTSESVAAVGLGQASADVRSTLLEHGLDLSSFDVASDSDASFSQQLSQGSPDRGTPGQRRAADDRDSASGADAAPGVITETTADGAPAGAWL